MPLDSIVRVVFLETAGTLCTCEQQAGWIHIRVLFGHVCPLACLGAAGLLALETPIDGLFFGLWSVCQYWLAAMVHVVFLHEVQHALMECLRGLLPVQEGLFSTNSSGDEPLPV